MTAFMQKIFNTLQQRFAPFAARLKRQAVSHDVVPQIRAIESKRTSHPVLKETVYLPCSNRALVRQCLETLSYDLFELAKQRQHSTSETRIVRSGDISKQQRFLYVQALNDDGWLFEQTAHGWTITRATFIAANATFLRARESWDQVTVLQAEPGTDTYRIKSERFAHDHLSYFIYRELIATALGLHGDMV